MSTGGADKDASAKKPDAPDNSKKLSEVTQFRDTITADGSSGFKAEANRYHLYVSWACPFAHRAILGRSLKGLDDVISMTVVDWMLDRSIGWAINPERPGCTADDVNHKKLLKEVYLLADPGFSGRVTVPVLWDKQKKTIVNNESAEVLRMLGTEFNAFCKTEEQKKLVLYSKELQKQIDEVNDWVFPNINIGVYKCGFSKTQEEYNKAVAPVFRYYDKAEKILEKSRYIAGNAMTEADVRLFTTSLRFDTVYYLHFKCNKKRLVDYPNIWGWLRDMYQNPLIKKTVNMDQIANHYYKTMLDINPFGITPIGPDLDFDAPHDRARLSK